MDCLLNTSLIAYYKLDEASGTRVDSVGSNDLTDNNTVTQAAGKVGNAGQFTAANIEYLSLADNADMSTGDIDFTIACWVYMDSKPGKAGIAGKYELNDSSLREWNMNFRQGAVDRFEFTIYKTDNTSVGVRANNFGAPSTGTWYFIVAWHDSVANTINMQVDNGAIDSTTTAGLLISDTAATFGVGARDVSGASAGDSPWDGRIDEFGFWKKVLSSEEKTDLYNKGRGNTLDTSATCVPRSKKSFLFMFD